MAVAEQIPRTLQPVRSETVADLLGRLGVGPERVRLNPPPGTATEADLVNPDDSRKLCELVDGVLVEKAVGFKESVIAVALVELLAPYVRRHRLGIVAGADGMMRLVPGLIRAPDVSFVRKERLSNRKELEEPIARVAPDLAVEILSRGNKPAEMERKLQEYFTAGARLVWYIDPRKRSAQVFTSPDQVIDLDEDGVLEGGDVVPGFQLRLGDLLDMAEDVGYDD